MGVRHPDRRGRSEALERELAAILPRIVDDDTEQVLLFGSAARGTVGSTSDLDLLVVRRDTRRPAEPADAYTRTDGDRALGLCAAVVALAEGKLADRT